MEEGGAIFLAFWLGREETSNFIDVDFYKNLRFSLNLT